MSWLLKSLQITDDSEPSSFSAGGDRSPSPPNSPKYRGGGVKEDFSVLGQSIRRQLRGIASFLAPPPSSASAAENHAAEERRMPSDSSAQQALVGIRNDLAEIGGNFKSGLSRLSNWLQFPSNLDGREKEGTESESEDDEFDEVPGISEEVVDFAKEISTRPGCWTDFPLSLDSDFTLSDAQKAHASAIELLVPGLPAVKSEVSRFMDDEQFWLVYFLLLMPRLNDHSLELLATSKVVETRDRLLLKLQQKREAGTGSSNSSEDHGTPEEAESVETGDVGGIVEKAAALNIERKETFDESSSADMRRSSGDEDDVSFSDLEVHDGDDTEPSGKPSASRNIQGRRASNASGSSDWVQLNRSVHGKDSEGESSDWFAVGDSD